MKNLKMLMLAVAGCLSLAACSNDDDNDGVNNVNAELVGTYKMSSWNAPVAVDFDDNGTANTNMMLESNCYTDSEMVVDNDGTYTMMYKFVNIDLTGNVTCETETTQGTWTRSGNSFTTTHLSGGQNMSTNYSFQGGDISTITRNMSNWNYPMINGEGNAEWGSGNVNYVMTRQ